MAAAPPMEMQSCRSAGPVAAPAAKMPGREVATVLSGSFTVSIQPWGSSGSPKSSAMRRVPAEGSMPTDRITMSMGTSMGRPMVVSSPLTTSWSPRLVISVTMPRTKFTRCSSWAFQYSSSSQKPYMRMSM